MLAAQFPPLLPFTAHCAAPCSGCTHIQLLLQLLIQLLVVVVVHIIQLLLQLLIQLLLPLTACQDCQLQEKCFHRLSWISQGGNVDSYLEMVLALRKCYDWKKKTL